MKVSGSLYDFVASWETFRPKPYVDATGTITIGYGHTRDVTMDTPPITRAQGIQWLREDMRIAETIVNREFSELRQCQFDALASLIFNEGWETIKGSKLHERIKEDKDSRFVAYEWIEFTLSKGIYLRGLLRRRIGELGIYYNW